MRPTGGKEGEQERPCLPLPREVRKVKPEEVSNKALLFERFLRWGIRNGGVKKDEEEVKEFLRLLSSGWDEKAIKAMEKFARRWEAMLGSLERQGFRVEKFEARPRWRAVFGLGGMTSLEVGFTFHKPLGFPIIPGSGLKGAARAYAKLVEGASEKDLQEVFGPEPKAKEHAQGKVIFFDAVPLGVPKIEPDVMNPHYGNYYRGDAPPADYLDPTLVPFITVGKESRFLFALASRDETALGKAARWLKGALTELGIGAKTSAGYGVFEVLHPAGREGGLSGA